MKVALTGSRGFIGSHLKTRLEEDGHTIEEWDLRQDPPKCIKDFDTFETDYVVHLAAYADVRQSLKEPDKYWWPGHHDYDPKHPDGHYEKTYGLRYDQFITPLIKAIQELSAKVEKLEKA